MRRDELTPDFRRQRCPFRFTRENTQIGRRQCRDQREKQQGKRFEHGGCLP
jgi:hypothetical protein